MKITFWSTLHGQACTTANMLAVALMITMKYDKKALITQTHYNLNNLESPLIGKVTEPDFFRDTGLDALIRNAKASPLTEEIIHNCSISLISQKLNLLIGTKQQSRSVFEEDTPKLIAKILKETERYYELVFIDINSGFEGAVTRAVLEEADIIVVNLRQNQVMLDNFFENDYQLNEKKIFYLFGSYDFNSKYSIKNIRRKYKKVNKKNSGIVPYNIEFSDSISDGSLMKYINRNLDADESNTSYDFLKCVEVAAYNILKFSGVLRGSL